MSDTFPYDITEHKVPSSYIREYPRALANSQEDTLTLAVKQYTPIHNPTPLPPYAITIIAAHANGFPKELYEPLFADLLTACQHQQPPLTIRSIWIADLAHQNESGILNEKLLGNDPGWHDHARDLTYLINLKRDQMPRPIFGLAHSVGGNNLVNVSLFNPRLFEGLILMDPVIQVRSAEPPERYDPIKHADSHNPWKKSVAGLSTFRRDVWPSHTAAAESFARSTFYKRWDPRVLDRWIKYGLRDLPSSIHPDEKPPKVTLATAVANEVHTFLRPNFECYDAQNPPNRETHADLDTASGYSKPFYRPEATRTLYRLPELRPSVLYIFASDSDVSDKQTNETKFSMTGTGIGGSGGREAGKVKAVTLEGVGHLIAMEATERAASETAKFIGDVMVRYRQSEEQWEREWKPKPLREKQIISEQWKALMGGDPRARKKKEGVSKL